VTDDDPILARRARAAALASLAQRGGYVLYGAALALFFYGLVAGFSRGVATLVVIALVAGSVLLAPAIIVGYAVRAADRADRDDDW
jgi:cation transporter-like permease